MTNCDIPVISSEARMIPTYNSRITSKTEPKANTMLKATMMARMPTMRHHHSLPDVGPKMTPYIRQAMPPRKTMPPKIFIKSRTLPSSIARAALLNGGTNITPETMRRTPRIESSGLHISKVSSRYNESHINSVNNKLTHYY